MKNLCFLILHNQSKFLKKKRDNVVTTKKIQIRNHQRFILCNQKSIIYEKKEWKLEFLDFLAVFQKYEKVEQSIKLKEWEKEQILDLLQH